MSEPNNKTKVAWLELEVKKQRDRIAELETALQQSKESVSALERQNAELRDALKQIGDGEVMSHDSPFTHADVVVAYQKIAEAALQAGKEPKE